MESYHQFFSSSCLFCLSSNIDWLKILLSGVHELFRRLGESSRGGGVTAARSRQTRSFSLLHLSFFFFSSPPFFSLRPTFFYYALMMTSIREPDEATKGKEEKKDRVYSSSGPWLSCASVGFIPFRSNAENRRSRILNY